VTVVTMDVSAEPGEGVDERLVRQLAARARAEGLKLTGEGGLLARLTKVVVESALEGEMDDHLGYGKHDPAGRNGGNSRNGARLKTLVRQAGSVEIDVPRDRESSFEPVIVAKRQRRLSGIDDLVISLSAKGLTHGEISAHLAEIYGAEVSKQTITAITDRVMEGMAAWGEPAAGSGVSGDLHRLRERGRSGTGTWRTGRSTSRWRSRSTGIATSWAYGLGSTVTGRAPSTGCGSSQRSRTEVPRTA
jgi:Transposase, Mutator family